jgi:hypothetical protein
VKITIAQLLSAKPALDSLGALSGYADPLAGYRINRLAARILPEFTAADLERTKILKKYGVTVRPDDPEPGIKTLVNIGTHETLRAEPMTPEEIADPKILANLQMMIPHERMVDFNVEIGTLMAAKVEVDAKPLPFELFFAESGNPASKLIDGSGPLLGIAGPFVDEPISLLSTAGLDPVAA